jgi:hypothetical protein
MKTQYQKEIEKQFDCEVARIKAIEDLENFKIKRSPWIVALNIAAYVVLAVCTYLMVWL